jgi:acyl-CoA thioester hydrolase
MEVKFSEADPLGIVWHGHYIRYFEDGREAFGQAYGLKYLDFYRKGEYKRILRYGHRIRVETTYEDKPAAKLLFHYSIYDAATNEQVATGSSMQVFMHKESLELMWTLPEFMIEWKKKWLKA